MVILIIFGLVILSSFIYVSHLLITSKTSPTFTGLSDGIMGTILTIFITFLLLRGQTQTEEDKEKNVEVFKGKVKAYTKFIKVLWDKYENENEYEYGKEKRITSEEYREIKKEFFQSVFIYLEDPNSNVKKNKSNKKKIISVNDMVQNLIELGGFLDMNLKVAEDEIRVKVRTYILEIINFLKSQIGLEADIDMKRIMQLDEELDVQKNDTTTTATTGITHWHFTMFNTEQQKRILEMKEGGVLVLGDGSHEKAKRSNLVSQIKAGDIIFIYSRGFGYVGICKAKSNGIKLDPGKGPRFFMPLEDGYEGQIAVEIIKRILDDKDTIGRDKPRLSTIQRISDENDIEELKKRFVKKEINLT